MILFAVLFYFENFYQKKTEQIHRRSLPLNSCFRLSITAFKSFSVNAFTFSKLFNINVCRANYQADRYERICFQRNKENRLLN